MLPAEEEQRNPGCSANLSHMPRSSLGRSVGHKHEEWPNCIYNLPCVVAESTRNMTMNSRLASREEMINYRNNIFENSASSVELHLGILAEQLERPSSIVI